MFSLVQLFLNQIFNHGCKEKRATEVFGIHLDYNDFKFDYKSNPHDKIINLNTINFKDSFAFLQTMNILSRVENKRSILAVIKLKYERNHNLTQYSRPSRPISSYLILF